jgi:hypothetical protein
MNTKFNLSDQKILTPRLNVNDIKKSCPENNLTVNLIENIKLQTNDNLNKTEY